MIGIVAVTRLVVPLITLRELLALLAMYTNGFVADP